MTVHEPAARAIGFERDGRPALRHQLHGVAPTGIGEVGHMEMKPVDELKISQVCTWQQELVALSNRTGMVNDLWSATGWKLITEYRKQSSPVVVDLSKSLKTGVEHATAEARPVKHSCVAYFGPTLERGDFSGASISFGVGRQLGLALID